jgi:hypothetical protein
VGIATNAPIGVLCAIVILPSRLNVAVFHRLSHQTSTSWTKSTQVAFFNPDFISRSCGLQAKRITLSIRLGPFSKNSPLPSEVGKPKCT